MTPDPMQGDGVAPPPWNRMGIALLALAGLFVASYMLLYKLGLLPLVACGDGVGCATVQASPWATFLGVPVPAWGIVGYGLMFAAALAGLQPELVRDRRIAALLLALATGAFAYSAYLSYLEEYVIGAWCRWCIVSAVLATLIFVLALFEIPRLRREDSHA